MPLISWRPVVFSAGRESAGAREGAGPAASARFGVAGL